MLFNNINIFIKFFIFIKSNKSDLSHSPILYLLSMLYQIRSILLHDQIWRNTLRLTIQLRITSFRDVVIVFSDCDGIIQAVTMTSRVTHVGVSLSHPLNWWEDDGKIFLRYRSFICAYFSHERFESARKVVSSWTDGRSPFALRRRIAVAIAKRSSRTKTRWRAYFGPRVSHRKRSMALSRSQHTSSFAIPIFRRRVVLS